MRPIQFGSWALVEQGAYRPVFLGRPRDSTCSGPRAIDLEADAIELESDDAARVDGGSPRFRRNTHVPESGQSGFMRVVPMLITASPDESVGPSLGFNFITPPARAPMTMCPCFAPSSTTFSYASPSLRAMGVM